MKTIIYIVFKVCKIKAQTSIFGQICFLFTTHLHRNYQQSWTLMTALISHNLKTVNERVVFCIVLFTVRVFQLYKCTLIISQLMLYFLLTKYSYFLFLRDLSHFLIKLMKSFWKTVLFQMQL